MRRHLGPIVFVATLVLATVGYLVLVLPIRGEIEEVLERIDAVNVPDLEHRAQLMTGRDDEALRSLQRKLDGIVPAPGDLWERLGLEDQPDSTRFKALFTEWHNRMQSEGILAPGAWPKAAWHSGPTIPSIDEKRATARLMLFLESLGAAARRDAGVRILRVRADDNARNIGLDLEFDPTRAGGLLDPVLRIAHGGEPFRLLEFTTDVAESGAATGRLRLALIDPE